jgi:hypothetical protein
VLDGRSASLQGFPSQFFEIRREAETGIGGDGVTTHRAGLSVFSIMYAATLGPTSSLARIANL